MVFYGYYDQFYREYLINKLKDQIISANLEIPEMYKFELEDVVSQKEKK